MTLLKVAPGKDKYKVFDKGGVKGFHAEVRRNGITFWLKWKDRRGRTKAIKLGLYGDVTLQQARNLAQKYRAAIALNEGDPHADRQRQKTALSVMEFIEQKFLPHQRVRKKSHKEDDRICRKRIIPAWGSRLLSEITPEDVSNFLDGIRAQGLTPATVNRHAACVKRKFALAVQWGLLSSNPARSFRLFPENNGRERFLSDDEIRRLYLAADTDPDIVGACAISYLMAEGSRRWETLTALWSDIDLEKRIWTIPNPKSGRKVQKHLNRIAMAVLQRLQAVRENEYVFPGHQEGTHRKTLSTVWKRLCEKAGIENCTLHSLRHSYASLLVRNGVSLFVVQRLLNHSSPIMSQRYSHLAPNVLASEGEKAAEFITAITAGGE